MTQGNRLTGPELTADEMTVCDAALQSVLRGEAADRCALSQATGFAPNRLDALMEELIERGLVVVETGSGQVVGSWGLSLVATEHRLHIQERELYTWCALDAIGIPAGLGEDATVTSHCRHCGAGLDIVILGGHVHDAEQDGVRIWVVADLSGRSAVDYC